MTFSRVLTAIASGGAISLSACIESPQDVIDYPAFVVPAGRVNVDVGDWAVTLSRADFAFGPVYFCAAASGSSTLCAASIAEVASVARVDGLSTGRAQFGTAHGFTGRIQSAAYDFGISWFDTSPSSSASALAPGGHSVVIEGEAKNGDVVVPFIAHVDAVPQYQGQRAVPTATATADVESDAVALEVHVDIARWLGQLDFDAIAATNKRPFVIDPDSPEHNAILIGMKNIAPPEFVWVAH